MRELEYPFDGDYVIRKRRKLLREIRKVGREAIGLRIAVLGGATTVEVVRMLELFLRDAGFNPSFYESDFGKFYEEAVFDNGPLEEFAPDVILFHTSWRNLLYPPKITDGFEEIRNSLEREFSRFRKCWETVKRKYGAVILQNNFERAGTDAYGHQSIADPLGIQNYIFEINRRIYCYKQEHAGFYVVDIEGMSAREGLSNWHDHRQWHLYKNAVTSRYVPDYAFRVSRIIGSIYGRAKKILFLDADNTLWGGEIGEYGADGIDIAAESASGQAFREWQSYLKGLKQKGVLLAVVSKNEKGKVREGLARADSILKEEDFVSITESWDDKASSVRSALRELNLGEGQAVFLDDSRIEREWIRQKLPEVTVPEGDGPEDFMDLLMEGGYFDQVSVTDEDLVKTENYRSDKNRAELLEESGDYDAYLRELGMTARVDQFTEPHFDRIVQLVNKTNQFNTTAWRISIEDIKRIAADRDWICIAGSLKDRFGDYGIVSVLLGEEIENAVHIRLFVLSCRAFGRQMEKLMLGELVARAKADGCGMAVGYYCPTKKNAPVKDLYEKFGFAEDGTHRGMWAAKMEDIGCSTDLIRVEGAL